MLKREATWEDAVIFYKGLRGQIGQGGRADGIISEIRAYYIRLQNLRKKK